MIDTWSKQIGGSNIKISENLNRKRSFKKLVNFS